MARQQDEPLSEAERETIFRIATSGFPDRYADAIRAGMNDEALSDALEAVLGIYGGSGGADRPSVEFTGAGLRIWGGRHFVAHMRDKPLFSGKSTIAMARLTYGVRNPDNPQMELF